MKNLIQSILNEYPTARKTSSFSGEHHVYKVFKSLRDMVADLDFVKSNPHLRVKFSCGQGNWSAVPWLAILDDREATGTQRGTYIVLLFGETGEGCHLKLAQGVTDFEREFGFKEAVSQLVSQANQIRELFLNDDVGDFDLSGDPKLELLSKSAKLYESSTILSKHWVSGSIPSDEEIKSSLKVLVRCYEKYIQNKDLVINPALEDQDGFNQSKKIWAIATGEKGRLWNEFSEQGIVAIGWESLGDLSRFRTQEEISAELIKANDAGSSTPMNDSLCCFQFVNEMKPGDIVIAKVGRKQILGGGIVESDYIYDSTRKEYNSIRKVNWVTKERNEFPGSGGAIKTLTEISRYPSFREFVEAYIADSVVTQKTLAEPYSYEEAMEDLFIGRVDLENIISTTQRKKNIILQGPPGVGKTFVSKRLAYLLMGEKDPSRIEYVQFHQSYSYEDFVQGWRPNSNGGFTLKNGSFYDFCEKARADLGKKYVFIIDEINRGNLSKIFGELLMLIESDKRGLANAIKLTYSETEADRFSVPENVFIVGLMNTADRSLALVDYALRRRFAFFTLAPMFDSEKFAKMITTAGGSPELVGKIRSRIGKLNQVISAQQRDLGPGFEIGHSYFCPVGPINSDSSWYESVVKTEIKPLIEEYWFDDPEKVESLVSELLA